ncbi:hypothetical protein HDE_09782 [Halotydeus destructor]|nr:hypothetical protein HDE_09782 [Halotydeus destructor]
MLTVVLYFGLLISSQAQPSYRQVRNQRSYFVNQERNIIQSSNYQDQRQSYQVNQVVNLKAKSVRDGVVQLQWKSASADSVFEVLVEDEDRVGIFSYYAGSDLICYLHGLCPASNYHFGIRTKADYDSDEGWSPRNFISYTTGLHAPTEFPVFISSAYEVNVDQDGSRTVVLHWEPAAICKSGPAVKFVIFQYSRGVLVNQYETNSSATFYIFRGLEFHASYNFEIHAANEIGLSAKNSRIQIYGGQLSPAPPGGVSLKYVEERSYYMLVWQASSNANYAISYIVSWCPKADIREEPIVHCAGLIKYKKLSASAATSLILSDEHTQDYEFSVAAVSAGQYGASSGFQWKINRSRKTYRVFTVIYTYYYYIVEEVRSIFSYAILILLLLLFLHLLMICLMYGAEKVNESNFSLWVFEWYSYMTVNEHEEEKGFPGKDISEKLDTILEDKAEDEIEKKVEDVVEDRIEESAKDVSNDAVEDITQELADDEFEDVVRDVVEHLTEDEVEDHNNNRDFKPKRPRDDGIHIDAKIIVNRVTIDYDRVQSRFPDTFSKIKDSEPSDSIFSKKRWSPKIPSSDDSSGKPKKQAAPRKSKPKPRKPDYYCEPPNITADDIVYNFPASLPAYAMLRHCLMMSDKVYNCCTSPDDDGNCEDCKLITDHELKNPVKEDNDVYNWFRVYI